MFRSRVLTGYANGDKTRPQQHTETYANVTKREAQARHAAHVAAVGAGNVSTSQDTLAAFLSRWLDSRASTWKSTTERRNRSIVSHLPAELTSIRLRDLKRGDVQRYVDTLPPSGARRIHAVLTGALAEAVHNEDEGLVANPASGIRLPRTSVPEPTPPTYEQLTRILGVAGTIDPLWADLFTFAAFTGLRRGEVAALRWADVSDDAVEVRHSLETGTKESIGSTWRLSDTKTHQTRQVPLSQRARRAIQRRRGNAVTSPTAFVFSQTEGAEPIHPDRISKMFAACAKGTGIQLKDLRSYAATVLAGSAGLKTAQMFLGHRDVTTTARHYAASSQSAVLAGLAALDAVADETPELTP